MKYIWLGIKDYIKDCWHDFWFKFWDALWDFTQRRTCKSYVWRNNDGATVKEGNLWHYIQQEQKISKGCKINLWKIIPHRHIYRLGDYGGKRCRRCGRFRKLEQKDVK